ncbi:hypothetical protein KOW79_002032 [Hemibagrus wyckioides]|uniref:Uncharacterized protein n=1 Tax=Hemibagrus wyckioides TaxID=337641 RepID=A0A9D3P2S2_9TELE|nr:hypothetical protein KOW79_002032 [Hemibagrus wyckioides]
MLCLWWIIFKTFFLLVRGGASSGSAEAAGGLNGGAGQNAVRAMNSMVLPQLVLIKQVPAPTGTNQIQGVGLPVLFTVVQQQQQEAGAPNPQVQVSPPMVPLLAFLPAEPNGVKMPQVQNVQQGAAAGNARVKMQ